MPRKTKKECVARIKELLKEMSLISNTMLRTSTVRWCRGRYKAIHQELEEEYKFLANRGWKRK